jgi:hypothetical protein
MGNASKGVRILSLRYYHGILLPPSLPPSLSLLVTFTLGLNRVTRSKPYNNLRSMLTYRIY